MTSERDEKVRQRAYEIWLREGSPEGRHEEHWEQARREIDNEADAAAAVGSSADAGSPAAPAAGKSPKARASRTPASDGNGAAVRKSRRPASDQSRA